MLMISLFLLIILTKSTYNKTPSKKNQFLTLLMNLTKTIKFPFEMFSLIQTIIITSLPLLTKKTL